MSQSYASVTVPFPETWADDVPGEINDVAWRSRPRDGEAGKREG